jgi:XRE family transcriptional regulator of biofilm formation
MNKGNDFAFEVEPTKNLNGYSRMASLENNQSSDSKKNNLANQPRGEASDAEPQTRRRGRKRGSANLNPAVELEPRRRKRDSEVIVGERIRRLRLEAGLSQEELGRSSKMSTSYISRLETGEVNPTVDALTRIVRVFGLSIDGLLELDTEAPQILSSEELDPEIRVWLFKLKGKPVSARTKRIIQTVIEEELKDLEGEAAS